MRTHLRYSRFEETDSFLDTENDDSEGNGQDQEGETPINASWPLPKSDTRVYKVSSIPL